MPSGCSGCLIEGGEGVGAGEAHVLGTGMEGVGKSTANREVEVQKERKHGNELKRRRVWRMWSS